jgi:DNA-binding LacI/PurR family transcriptional regulator
MVFVGGQYTQEDSPHDHYRRLADLQLPTVLVNAPVAGIRFPTVSTDDAVAIELAWNHLVQLGHRHIGLVLGPEDHLPSRRKLEAAKRMSASSGVALPPERIAHSHYNLEAGQAATARLLGEGVTAVICASDPLALGAVRAVRRAGLTVPGDVSVVGFDDSALMNSTDPPLTTVRQPIEPMGRMVIEMLVTQLAGTKVAAEEYLFEPELVVRGSTGRAVERV